MNALTDSVLVFLADAALKGTLILLLACAAIATLRRASSATRHLIWLLALVLLAVVPVLSLVLPDLRVGPRWLPARGGTPAPAVKALPMLTGQGNFAAVTRERPDRGYIDGSAMPAPTSLEPSMPRVSAPVSQPPEAHRWAELDWREALLLAWGFGALLCFLPTLIGAFSLLRLSRTAAEKCGESVVNLVEELTRELSMREAPRLLCSNRRAMPMTWGVYRPQLLLPEGFDAWPSQRQRVVVLHELAHVRRRDCLWQWVTQIICAAYWYHPLAWFAAYRMRVERERACDDVVLRGGAAAPDYADHLLQIASGLESSAFAAHAAIAMARPTALERRLRAIVDPRANRRSLTIATILFVTVAAAIAAIPLAMLKAAERSPRPPSTTPSALQPAANVRTVQVRARDEDGKPVSNAQVYIVMKTPTAGAKEEFQRFGPAMTDDIGMASVSSVPKFVPSESVQVNVFARSPGKMVGANHLHDLDKLVDVKMSAACPTTGKVSVPEGFDVTKVKVSILVMSIRHNAVDQSYLWLEDGIWPGLFDQFVASDGSFSISEVPAAGGGSVAATGPGLAETQLGIINGGLSSSGTVAMHREGVIKGILTDAVSGAPQPDVLLQAGPESIDSHLFNGHRYTAKTDANGRFRIGGLPQAFYTLTLMNDGGTPIPKWVMPARENVLVRWGAIVEDVRLQVQEGAIVTGRVLDAETGVGIAGAEVSEAGVGHSISDAEGRYRIRLPVGSSRIYLPGVPDEYQPLPSKENHRTVVIDKGERAKDGPTYTLHRRSQPPKNREAATVRGRIVDAAGKPVGGAWIGDDRIERWGGDMMPVQDSAVVKSDVNGNYELKVIAGIKHRIFVSGPDWRGPAIREIKEFVPKPGETIELPDLSVQPNPILGNVAGIVVDPQGRVIEGAVVQSHELLGNDMVTDATGYFSRPSRETPGMVDIRATGFDAREWYDVPLDVKNLRFLLYPSGRPGISRDDGDVRQAKTLLNKPAPAFDVEQWVYLPNAQQPSPRAGRWTLLALEYACSEPASCLKRLKQLETEAARIDAAAIVIFGTNSHEAGIHAMLGDEKPSVAIGIDRPIVDSPSALDGATVSQYGVLTGRRPTVVIDDKGIVRHVQKDPTDLAATVLRLQGGKP